MDRLFPAARIALALAMAGTGTGCVPAGHLVRYRAPAPSFDPIAFFAGPTEGVGSLKIAFRHRQATLVRGTGRRDGDAAIVLDQDVRRGDEKPTHRTWRLHRVAPGRYAGTLTDASGPVAGDVLGNRLHLAFAMKGGLKAEQWLYLQPGGEVARNRMVVTKFGIPVASLDEVITRLPADGGPRR